jgi:hypothetical protein
MQSPLPTLRLTLTLTLTLTLGLWAVQCRLLRLPPALRRCSDRHPLLPPPNLWRPLHSVQLTTTHHRLSPCPQPTPHPLQRLQSQANPLTTHQMQVQVLWWWWRGAETKRTPILPLPRALHPLRCWSGSLRAALWGTLIIISQSRRQHTNTHNRCGESFRWSHRRLQSDLCFTVVLQENSLRNQAPSSSTQSPAAAEKAIDTLILFKYVLTLRTKKRIAVCFSRLLDGSIYILTGVT